MERGVSIVMLGARLLDHEQSASEQSSSTLASELVPSDDQSKCCSLSQRVKDIPLNILSLIPILIGISHWNQCDSIPLLPLYLVCYGGINVIRSVVSFHWNIPRDNRLMNEKLVATKVVRVIGLLVVCISIWGTVLTLRDVNEYFPTGGDNCSRAVYLSGLFSSVSTVALVFIIILVLLFRMILDKCMHKTRKNRDIRYFYESYYSSDSLSSSDSSSLYGSSSNLSDDENGTAVII